MANEDVLGPRKTMFVLVIVVGCFAVLWPRILSPLILGHTRDQLKPNQFDREAGCCEVMFATEVAVLELINEVCSSVVPVNGKLSPFAAAECRKTVNETCGVDIAAFLKRDENVGKTTKKLLDTMKSSNSSCLKEHFGVPKWTISSHQALNYWILQDPVKQERPPMRTGTHPALRERGRAIPVGVPTPPSKGPVAMPPHVRVRSSPLEVYFELDIKPPPIPGMRPPLGSPGGPVPAPKSSMGFVMPIYTICIIVFFVYTLSKILFKRTGSTPYETISPDPQFRRRVFRDDSRTSPDKLVVTAISGLVAEVQQQMEASYAQNQQRQDLQDNHARPYTNGTVLHNSGPVHIVASEYREKSKESSSGNEKFPEPILEGKEPSPEPAGSTPESKELISEPKEFTPEPKELVSEHKELTSEPKELTSEPKELTSEPKELTPEPKELTPEPIDLTSEPKELTHEVRESTPKPKETSPELKEPSPESEEEIKDSEHNIKEHSPESENVIQETAESISRDINADLIKLTENIELVKDDSLVKGTEEFLNDAKFERFDESSVPKQSTPELLEEALKEESSERESENGEDDEKGTVKVIGMELTAHTADGASPAPPPLPAPAPTPARPHEAGEVKSIYLEGEIPQQSRVLVAEFEDRADRPAPTKHSPMVVSGKMTLSLIQDAPRDTPEKELESTVDDFTTASAFTQPVAEKDDELSEEEVDEEIEVEEIEEEVEELSEEEIEETIPEEADLANGGK